jgi:OFA family oxalate/formate antiporter-like MFS transporter
MAINLCLGILYAWSVWKKALSADKLHIAGSAMTGHNLGWHYLTDAQATWAYTACGFIFALSMIPGGKIQDRYGPRFGVTLGGLFLAVGCIIAGLMQSYIGLLLGFGVLGGIGMGLGYASATPAAVRWFGPHRRGLIVGIVVGGYGGAAIYISPLATSLIANYGISGSFIALGILFAVVVIIAGRLLVLPPEGYIPPAPASAASATKSVTTTNWSAAQMVKTWQFYALVFIFFGSAQSGLLVIGNAAKVLNETAKSLPFFTTNAWLLASFGGFVNAVGRIGTGLYSDKIGRSRAYLLNCAVSACCLLATPSVMASHNVGMLFLVVGVAYWQYGGGLALLPSFTADYFGPKNLGFNYGLVFFGWGVGFFVSQLAGYWKDMYGSLDMAFYLSGTILIVAVIVSQLLRRPIQEGESG